MENCGNPSVLRGLSMARRLDWERAKNAALRHPAWYDRDRGDPEVSEVDVDDLEEVVRKRRGLPSRSIVEAEAAKRLARREASERQREESRKKRNADWLAKNDLPRGDARKSPKKRSSKLKN
jgi:hypothetical protein